MLTHVRQVVRPVLLAGLYLGVIAAIIWYMSPRRGEPLFVGYTPEYWGPLAVAGIVTGLMPVRAGRRAWLLTLGALGLTQLLLAFLLDYVVNFGVEARRPLELALPISTLFVFLIGINPVARWLNNTAETDAAYAARAAYVAAMAVAGAALLSAGTVLLAVSRPAQRWLLDDGILGTLAGYAGFMTTLALSDPVARGLFRAAPVSGDESSSAAMREVRQTLSRLARVRNGLMFGLTYMVLGLAAAAHVWLGKSADPFVVVGLMAGLIAPIVVILVAERRVKRAWHARIQGAGLGLAAIRAAAAGTEVAFPETDG